MPASAVSSPVAVTRTRRLPSPLIVPPMTSAPGSLPTGFDSPVSMASFTSERPSSTTPSAGTLAPGRTSTRSPGRSSSTGTSSMVPSSRTRSAMSGISFASSFNAPDACRTLRISIQWPSSMMSISVAISQKKPVSGFTNRANTL